MLRSSPFRIVLTSVEQEKLETQARKYTSPYRNVIRAKIVLLAAQGLSNDVIATRLDTPRQIVSKWRKRFALARLPGLEEQPRGGRPCLPRPNSVAGCPVPWLSPRFRYHSAVRLLTKPRSPLRFRL